jgi:hypothetical protein
MMIKRIALVGLLALACGAALAKLPALSDEAKAKAAEAAAKTAWGDKVAAFQLCKSMDRTASYYYAEAKKAGREAKPPTATPACTDPGAFVYTPPGAKPPEAAGAHSPPGTAVSPPSMAAPAAPTPAKKS